MGLWRFIETLYGEAELWVPERGVPREWPEASDYPPCDICTGRLTRRSYQYEGKDKQSYTGWRYTLTHYAKPHNEYRSLERRAERRKTA